MSLPKVKKGSSVGRVRTPYSFPQSTLVNYYVGGSGVGAVTTANRNALRKRAAWRPIDGGKAAIHCKGFCNNNNQYRVCRDNFCTTSTYFNPTDFASGANKIFVEDARNHHINIVTSGTGSSQNVQVNHSPPKLPTWKTVHGGFNSLMDPFPSQYYAAFTGTGTQDPNTLHQNYHPELDQFVSSQGRYLRSKPIKELNLPTIKSAENKDIHIKSWDDLAELKIVWIAGRSFKPSDNLPANGADSPDVREWMSSAGIVYPRRPEDLYVEFYDANNLPVGSEIILWKTKREPTPAEYAIAATWPTTLSAYDTTQFNNILYRYGSLSPFYTSEPLNWAPDGKYWSMATIDTSRLDLKTASFFIIKQRRHTGLLDNYGVKHVELKFKYGCYPN
jgi:hypothetical protein